MKRLLLAITTLSAAIAAEAQNPYPIVPIDSVQFVSSQKLTRTPPNDSPDYVNPVKVNPTFGDTVRLEGIVMMSPKAYGLSSNRKATFIQRAGAPWAAVQIMCDPAGYKHPNNTNYTLAELIAESKFYDNMKPGYLVRITGVIRQFNGSGFPYGETQVNIIPSLNPGWSNEVELLSLTPTAVNPVVLRIDSFETGNIVAGNLVQKKLSGEPYEGQYVEFQNVTVFTRTGPSGNRFNWSVIDDNGNAIDIRDVSGYYRNDGLEDTSMHIPHTFAPPSIGSRLAYIRGVITEASVTGTPNTMRYFLAPLGPTDVGPVTYSPPQVVSVSRTPVIATSADSVSINVKTQKGGARIAKGMLFYTLGYNSTNFDSVSMTKTVADTTIWTAKIPPMPANSVVKYWVRISDQNDTAKNYPDVFGTNSAYLVTNTGITSIQDLNFSPYPSGNTIWHNDSLVGIDVRGIVTGINFVSGTTNIITVQDGTQPKSGIFIQRGSPDATSSWAIGDSVSITRATVRESFNITTLNNIQGTVIASGRPLPAFMNVTTDSITNSGNLANNDELEGMLIKAAPAWVANVNPDAPSNFGEFSVNTDSTKTSGLRVDDMNASIRNINLKLKNGMKMDYIQGPLYYSFGNYKLMPRSLSDIDLSRIDSVKPVIVLVGNAYDTIQQFQSYTDPGATATDDIDGTITSRIVRTGMVDSSMVGTYTLTYKVSDNWGNMDSVQRFVTVKLYIGEKENEFSNVNVNVYPSPAREEITVAAAGIRSLPVQVSIVDILGRELVHKTYTQSSFSETLSLASMDNGVYFCTISNEKGSRTVKFMVAGK